jgi:putative hemolysin
MSTSLNPIINFAREKSRGVANPIKNFCLKSRQVLGAQEQSSGKKYFHDALG